MKNIIKQKVQEYIAGFPHKRARLWVIWYSMTIHLVWGGMMVSGIKVEATPVSEINSLAGDVRLVGWMIIAVAAFALYGLLNTRFDNIRSLLFIAPQQVLLYISAWTCLQAVLSGQYADGTERLPVFILADQLPTIVIAIWHSIAIISSFNQTGENV